MDGPGVLNWPLPPTVVLSAATGDTALNRLLTERTHRFHLPVLPCPEEQSHVANAIARGARPSARGGAYGFRLGVAGLPVSSCPERGARVGWLSRVAMGASVRASQHSATRSLCDVSSNSDARGKQRRLRAPYQAVGGRSPIHDKRIGGTSVAGRSRVGRSPLGNRHREPSGDGRHTPRRLNGTSERVRRFSLR